MPTLLQPRGGGLWALMATVPLFLPSAFLLLGGFIYSNNKQEVNIVWQ